MLHMGILPNHRLWDRFLAQLEVVVVDEAHVYRGVFGSHVGNVLRGLRPPGPGVRVFRGRAGGRISGPGARVPTPGELAERRPGSDRTALVDGDGSPQPRRHIAMWNPPI